MRQLFRLLSIIIYIESNHTRLRLWLHQIFSMSHKALTLTKQLNSYLGFPPITALPPHSFVHVTRLRHKVSRSIVH